jgi:Uma2 family endonuclease
LAPFVREHGLGEILAAGTGFVIGRNPDTVRSPDVSFISRDHWPTETPDFFFEGAPDLAVEVVSPNDRYGEVLAKVQDWLNAGCPMVWVTDLATRSVTVYWGRAGEILHVGDELTGGDLLPGFRLSVAEIFA